MNFDLKIQNISNIDPTNKKHIAVTHVFDLEDQNLLNKKGKMMAVLSIRVEKEVNLASAIKVFLDTIRENYYKIIDETPLFALESSVSQGLRLLQSFKTIDENYNLSSYETKAEISLSVALIWNRVLYINYYGGGVGYILRGSGIRDISSQDNNLNEIWTNSSILDNDDVIILGTKEFSNAFPANTIVENFNDIPSYIAESLDRNLMAALFVKLTSSKNEEIPKNTFGEYLKNISTKGGLTERLSMVKDVISKTEKLSDRFKIYQKKKVAPVSSISGIIPTVATTENIPTGLTKTKRLNRDKSKKTYKNFATTALGAIFLGVISLGTYYAITNTTDRSKPKVLNYSTISEPEIISDEEVSKPTITDLHQIVEISKEFKPKIFQIKDNTNVLLIDDQTGGLENYSITNKNSLKLGEFSDAEFLKCDTKLCYFISEKSLFVMEPKEKANIDKYLIDEIGMINEIHPYNNKVYILASNTIYQQFLQSQDAPSTWIKDNTTFTKPIDMAIDGNVYVLDNNKIIKLYSGRKIAEYNISDRVSDGIDIEVDLRNLYVLDKQKRTIFVFNKGTGEFVKEIILTNELDPSTIDQIVAYEKTNTTTLYFLKNGKIFKVQ
jgi:hypothetical protein